MDPAVVDTGASGPERVRNRQDFARELTLLRERSGLTVRQVAGKTGVFGAHSTIGDWFAGRGLPSTSSTGLLVDVLKVCGIRDAELIEQWLQAWRRARRMPGRRPGKPEPYRGLVSFQPQDAEWFFGRVTLTGELLARLAVLQSSGGGIQVVVGASGSGKSSLLRAGLIPAVRAGGLPGSAAWPVLLLTPGSRPLEQLCGALSGVIGGSVPEMVEVLRTDPDRCALYVRQTTGNGHPVVVVDQFEELFTACADDAQRQAFVAALSAAACAGALVVAGLRADFYAHVLRYPQMVAAVQAGQLAVGTLSQAELREVIVEPARKANLDVEDGLVELLMRDITPHGGSSGSAHDSGALPLLSHALYATWSHGHGRRLTIANYREVGGISGAVAASASRVYDELTAPQQELARRLFLGLVHVAADTADTRRRAVTTELLAGHDHAQALEEVLDRFVAQRLITADADTVQISHEILLTAWPRLRSWLDTDRAGLVIGRRLEDAAAAWHREERDPALLYRGAQLAAAADWAENAGPHATLTSRVREFLGTSTQRELAEQHAARRRTRRLRQLVASLSVLLVTTMVTAVIAVKNQQTATEQRNTAISRKVGNDAAALRISNPALAAQLSLAAYRLAPTVEARSSLLSTFATPYAIQLTPHTESVSAVRFSPDGRILATASPDQTVRLWDVLDPHRPHELSVLPLNAPDWTVLAFGPDGRTLATANGMVHLWDIADPRHPVALTTLPGAGDTYAVAFGPDGHTLASGNGNGTARLWDITDRQHPGELGLIPAHAGGDTSVAFSPDGRILATTGHDHTARLWDVTDPRSPNSLGIVKGHTDAVTSAAFNADGRTLATASDDHTARLWDITDPHNPTTLAVINGHTDALAGVSFSPDKRLLATASLDNTVRVWDISDQRQPYERTVLNSHPGRTIDIGAVSTVAFSPNGRTLASGGYDHLVHLWDVDGPVIWGRTSAVRPIAFGPQGRTLTIQSDRAARLWDIADPDHPTELTVLTGTTTVACDEGGSEIICVASSPDGRTLATGSTEPAMRLWDVKNPYHATILTTLTGLGGPADGAAFSPRNTILVTVSSRNRDIRLWDIADPHHPQELATLSGHTAPVNTFAFSPDGRIAATTSYDRTARLWNIDDPRHPATLAVLTGHTSAVYSVAFRPDGKVLATTSQDQTVRLWDIANPGSPTELATLTGHTNFVNQPAFSPDGHTLATGSGDNSVRLWNITDPRHPTELATLLGHADAVNDVVFSADGQTLATGGFDHTTRLWDVSIERITRRICKLAYPTITRAEWNKYLADVAYQPPCATA